MEGLAAVAPLYHEVLLVVVWDKSELKEIIDLRGKRIGVGPEGSGMRFSAVQLLDHYGINGENSSLTEDYFKTMETNDQLDAVVITSGVLNPDLEEFSRLPGLRVIPIIDAEAFCMRNPSFQPFKIPRGLYGENPPHPSESLQTVATTAFLGTLKDAPDSLVEATIKTLFETDLRAEVPILFSRRELRDWEEAPIHPESRRYLEPYADLEIVGVFMESIAAGKELLFALLAAVYLLWTRWKDGKAKKAEEEMVELRERLDVLLDETIRIEREQMEVTDPDKLKEFLDEVTRIKLKALDELSHEDLRGDRRFLIFMAQCSHLIDKLQGRVRDEA